MEPGDLSTVLNSDGHEVEVITGNRKGGLSRPGEVNPMAALSDDAVRELRILRYHGWAHTDLAMLFGVSIGRSSEICRGMAYKAAGGPIERGPRVYNTSVVRAQGSQAAIREQVIELHERGLSQRAIAAKVGKSKTFVHDTIQGYQAGAEQAAA